MEAKKETRLAKLVSFHDDLVSATKIFVRLNAYRRLNGCKPLQRDQVLCELAVSRSHQLVRSRSGIMQMTQIGGARFNLGVSFVDLASYMYVAKLVHLFITFLTSHVCSMTRPIEEKDGKRVPVHRTMEHTWMSFSGFSEAVLDPLARFAAVSVYASEKMVCVTIFVSILPPTLFPPKRLKKREGKRKNSKKKKSGKGKKRSGEGKDATVSTDTESDSDSVIAAVITRLEDMKSPAIPETTDKGSEERKAAVVEAWPNVRNHSGELREITNKERKDVDMLEIGELSPPQQDVDASPARLDMSKITPIDINAFEEDVRKVAAENWPDGRVYLPGGGAKWNLAEA